jgi:hypothetical protein
VQGLGAGKAPGVQCPGAWLRNLVGKPFLSKERKRLIEKKDNFAYHGEIG